MGLGTCQFAHEIICRYSIGPALNSDVKIVAVTSKIRLPTKIDLNVRKIVIIKENIHLFPYIQCKIKVIK